MAKIDTTNIQGYEDMTPEEKVAALEALEYNDGSAEIERYKAAATKANSEAASWKKKHNALLSDEDKNKQEREEELTNLRTKVENLEKEKAVSGHQAKLLAMGYDEELAKATAEAMAEGDTAKVFEYQKKFIEAHDKNLEADLLKNTPNPPAGKSSGDGVDYAKKAEEAQANGNLTEAAYYTRLAQEKIPNDK